MSEQEDKDIGFSGIGKRIENLKDDDSTKVVTDLKQENEKPQQAKLDSTKQQDTPNWNFYKTTAKKKAGTSFRLSFGKVFWVIVAIIIISSIFSQNNDKKKTNYSPNNNNAPAQRSVSPPVLPSDEYVITDGKFRCNSYQHDMAQTLLPSLIEKQDIKRLQNFLKSEENELDQMKTQVEMTHVDNYSQNSVDYYNMLSNDYNSRLETYKNTVSSLQRKIDSYNTTIINYNNYLMANCKKAY